mmetsp:Transcript_8511/g.35010  ORF Transcript_8511/g.35010 Transcript_8511/m.35010 type:complete len:428 (-) Transcript_8511:93-1376(-)
MRRLERVEHECLALKVGNELRPQPPLGPQLVEDARLHPRRKALVEPQVVPPLHGHEVAEPLVREFVDDDFGDALKLARRRGGFVDEQVDLSVRHETPVLHRARRELRDGHHVGFRERVRQVEGLVVLVERGDRALEGEGPELGLAGRREDADHDLVLGQHRDDVELADAERQQIGRHARRLHELDRLPRRRGLVVVRVDALLRHIGERRQVRGHGERRLEGRLAERLVPAREAASSVDRLKLCRGHQLGFAAEVGVGRPIEAAHGVVEHASVFDPQARLAAREQNLRRLERDGSRVVVNFGRDHVDPVDRRHPEGQVLGVERQRRRRGRDGDSDFHDAVEGVVVEADLQLEVVRHRIRVRRQEHAARVAARRVRRTRGLRLAAPAQRGQEPADAFHSSLGVCWVEPRLESTTTPGFFAMRTSPRRFQ